MAPEQIEGKPVGPATDIYSLGVVLYEMLTGVSPFKGGLSRAGLLKRLQRPPPSPRGVCPDIDAQWDAIVVRCLELDRGRAPQRAVQSATDVPARAEGATHAGDRRLDHGDVQHRPGLHRDDAPLFSLDGQCHVRVRLGRRHEQLRERHPQTPASASHA
jgi:serine/threonine protein kinase